MAKENIAKFFDAAVTDRALSEQVATLAAESGYDFAAEELLELGAARPLSDESAEGVHGGLSNLMLFPSGCPHVSELACDSKRCTYTESCKLASHCLYVGGSCRYW